MSEPENPSQITFRTDLTETDISALFTELINSGIHALGSSLLSLHKDLSSCTAVDLGTKIKFAEVVEERSHPMLLLAATGELAHKVREFLAAEGVKLEPSKLYLDIQPVEIPPAPEAPSIIVP
jgi:hypothetical protein